MHFKSFLLSKKLFYNNLYISLYIIILKKEKKRQLDLEEISKNAYKTAIKNQSRKRHTPCWD